MSGFGVSEAEEGSKTPLPPPWRTGQYLGYVGKKVGMLMNDVAQTKR